MGDVPTGLDAQGFTWPSTRIAPWPTKSQQFGDSSNPAHEQRVRAGAPSASSRQLASTPSPRERPILRGLSAEVELEQLFEDHVVPGVRRPSVGGKDGPVEIIVSVGEPGRALVVEVRQCAFREFRLGESGRVEPTVAELDEELG